MKVTLLVGQLVGLFMPFGAAEHVILPTLFKVHLTHRLPNVMVHSAFVESAHVSGFLKEIRDSSFFHARFF